MPPEKLMILFKIYNMLRRYKFLRSIAKTSAMLAFKVALLRKQIMTVLTIYKIYDLLAMTYREY